MTQSSSTASVVNEIELRVVGMSRSGNHAVINWILAQATGRVVFLNCAEARYNPYFTARPLDNGVACSANYDDFQLEKEMSRDFSHKDWLVYSHEDTYLGKAASRDFEDEHDGFVGPSRRRIDLLVMRDPFNLFASRMRMDNVVNPLGVAVRMWKQHAREALGQTSRLPHERIVVLFNNWCRSRAYRKEIAEQIGLTFTDAGRQQVTRCHGGSSFDGLNYDGRAEQMKVLERWRKYEDDPSYQDIFRDPQLLEHSQKLFGEIPGTRRWMKSLELTTAD